jgi:hypothetical protein
MRLILTLVLACAASAAAAQEFSFAGLSLRTTLEELKKRYPSSRLADHYMYVSEKDSHDHVYGVEIPRPGAAGRLRLSFEHPQQGRGERHPSCRSVADALQKRYGAPSRSRDFMEEGSKARRVSWVGAAEEMSLQCFQRNGEFRAEALTMVERSKR